jgi:hypothetical protein
MTAILHRLIRKAPKRQLLHEIVPQETWQKRNLFAVITWGSTATSWISKILNHHPEIFCVHELAMILDQSKLYASNDLWAKFDPIDFMKIIARLSVHYKVGGDVHSLRTEDVPPLREFFGERFSSVVIEREPISRLKSTISMYNKRKQYKLFNIQYVDDIISRNKVSLPKFDYEHKLFVHGVNLLNIIEQEINHNCGKIFRMEDLISDTKQLKLLIEEISSGELSADNDLLNKMIKTYPTNQRASKEKIEFEDWQIDVIKLVVSNKAWDLYSKVGYDKPHFI